MSSTRRKEIYVNRVHKSLMAALIAGSLIILPLAGLAFAASSGQTGPRNHAKAGLISYVASVEGVSSAVLHQDLQAGETLRQIAGSKYASADDLATALLSRFKTKMDRAVSNNRLTASQEDALYNRLHGRVAQLVTIPHPKLRMLFAHGKRAAGQHALAIRPALLRTLVSTCNTTPAALKSAIRTGGQTPLAVCQATNPSVTQESLVTALTSAIQTRLDAAVSANAMTSQQESQILSQIQSRLNQWVTTTMPAGGWHHA
jgi:hypothetical protein